MKWEKAPLLFPAEVHDQLLSFADIHFKAFLLTPAIQQGDNVGVQKVQQGAEYTTQRGSSVEGEGGTRRGGPA